MKKYDSIVTSAAKEYRIDPSLIRAIISIESSWNPNAIRYEKHINDTSYGLMQVLLKTGRWMTNNKSLTAGQLRQPTVNILVGTKYLRYLWNRHKNLDDVIASYNAGSPRRKRGSSSYINQRYVNKVKSVYRTKTLKFPIVVPIIFMGGLIYLSR